MEDKINNQLGSVLFIPHGGGPLPLLGDEAHNGMIEFLETIALVLKPTAVLLISAHWEETNATITSSLNQSLIYDYYGFPEEAYEIQYPVHGSPALAHRVHELLKMKGIESTLDSQRGFDHGVFVPLKIMFPDASVPCVQLSLINSLSPQEHINIGKALSELKKDKILIIGSGFTFHNLKAIFSSSTESIDIKNEAFEKWLVDTCTNENIFEQDREIRLNNWESAPYARYCHPREEHLMPLHVCYGIAGSAAKLVFNEKIFGKKTSAFLW